MNTNFKSIMKNFFFDMKYSNNYTQIFNYIIMIFLITITKIFLILQVDGNTFTTPFENCVWIFMVVILILRMCHSFNLLHGYWIFSSIPLMFFFILSGTHFWLINLSVIMVMIFKAFELKELFANVGEPVA